MGIKTFIDNYLNLFRYYNLAQILNMVRKRLISPNSTHLFYNPSELIMHIISKCNYNCLFCFGHAPSVPKNYFNFEDMYFDNFVKIVDRFKGANIIHFSGGEPFLNLDIFKMIRYANSKNILVEVTTNGSLLHDKIKQIVNSTIRRLNISLNADNSSEYGRIHGISKSTFFSVLEAITDLVDKKGTKPHQLMLTMSHVTTKKNYKKIPNMIKLAEELGVDHLHFHNMMSIGLPSYPKDQSLYEDDSEVIEFIENIEPPSSKLGISMPQLFRHDNIKRICKKPFTTIPIYGNGNVAICCAINPRKEFGNVLLDKNVWNNSYFKRIRKIMLDDSEPLPEFCKNCNLNYIPYKVFVRK